jgi:hypothetical protein
MVALFLMGSSSIVHAMAFLPIATHCHYNEAFKLLWDTIVLITMTAICSAMAFLPIATRCHYNEAFTLLWDTIVLITMTATCCAFEHVVRHAGS